MKHLCSGLAVAWLAAVLAPAAWSQCYISVPGGPLPAGVVGAPYSVEFHCYTYASVFFGISGSAPPGLSLVYGPYNDIVYLEGTPTVPGSYSFCLSATCAPYYTTATECYTLDVVDACAPPLVVTPAALPGGSPWVPYSVTLTASGGTPPYTFSINAGSTLPPGLGLSAAGILSGTPGAPGDYAFDVLAWDATCVTRVPLQISLCEIDFDPASALPDAALGAPYGATLTGLLGSGPYAFAIVSGATPPGISLASAGALAGTPTSMGSFSFTVEATDGTGCKARHTVRLDVTEVVADFSGAPRIVAPGSTVSFTDASAGSIVSRQWAFGDGNNSNAANPTHAYQAAGRYNVSLRVDGPTTSDLETKPDYVLVSSVSPGGLVTGQGPAANAAPLILGFDAVGVQSFTRFAPYPTAGYGANVGSGDIDGTAPDEILTGPGPSVILGPHVRAFRPTSTPIAKVSFYAYSTLSYGVHADGVGLDGDAPDEIVATPGPGGVFGPHVRGFNFDGGVLAAMPGVSFYAYGTLKFGARAAGGDIDGSGGEEILTGPGPGAMFSTQVRGFRYGPPVAAIAKVNFVAFTYTSYGANVAGGNVDGDAYDEILVGGGPDPDSWYYWSEWFSLFDYDGQAISVIVFEYQPFGYGLVYGVEVAAGDLDGNPATDEILVGQGPDPTARQVAAFSWSGASVVPIVPLAFVPPYVTKFGVHVTAGQFGF